MSDYPDYTIPVAVIGTVTVTGSVTVSGTVAISGTVTVTGSVTVSGTVSISGTVTVTGSVTVSGTVSISGTVTVTGSVTVSGTVSISGTVSVSGTVSISGTVTVTGSVTVSGTVSISGTVSVSGTVSISGSVTVTGSVTVSGTVSISGSVTVTGSVSVSGTVTISTLAADNIIIDKLVVGAYTERRSTLSNNGAAATWVAVTGAERWGKFFPRGARGFIRLIDVYCKDAGAAGGTITVYISPQPSIGYLYSATITVPAGGGEAWRSATFNRMWNYDSLFIMAVCSIDSLNMATDSEANFDGFYSSNSGATWVHQNWRYWFRVVMKGETVGDIPVSGTINTVQIPNVSSGGDSGSINIPSGVETSILIMTGSGIIERIALYTSHDDVVIRFYIDGVQIPSNAPLAYSGLTPSILNTCGYTATTPQIQLTKFSDGGECFMATQIKFNFKRSFEIRAYQTTGLSQNVRAGVITNNIT